MIENLIAIIHKNGWLINNLFQTGDGWQANLRTPAETGISFFEFGKGETAAAALEDAMKKAEIEGLALYPWD